MVDAVHLRGGPCDGQEPEALPGTTFPGDLRAITVMDHAASVGHVYELTGSRLIDDNGLGRTVLGFRRTVARDS